jgi:hypothetical protein
MRQRAQNRNASRAERIDDKIPSRGRSEQQGRILATMEQHWIRPETRLPRQSRESRAVEWEVIEPMPIMGRLLPVPRTSAGFLDFDDYERLVEASRATDSRALLIVVLGGEAGLRCGEMMALSWADVDGARRRLMLKAERPYRSFRCRNRTETFETDGSLLPQCDPMTTSFAYISIGIGARPRVPRDHTRSCSTDFMKSLAPHCCSECGAPDTRMRCVTRVSSCRPVA